MDEKNLQDQREERTPEEQAIENASLFERPVPPEDAVIIDEPAAPEAQEETVIDPPRPPEAELKAMPTKQARFSPLRRRPLPMILETARNRRILKRRKAIKRSGSASVLELVLSWPFILA